jgi:serine/threonine-protein phosphatase 2B catalytic subunit
MELIRDVVDGRDANADSNVRELAEVISSPVRSRPENSLA